MAMDKNAHRMSKSQSMYNEAMGSPKAMGARKAGVMMADGGDVRMKEMAADKNPIMRAKGGSVMMKIPKKDVAEEMAERTGKKPVKRAMGGVGKYRHDAASEMGAPKPAPRGKMGRGI